MMACILHLAYPMRGVQDAALPAVCRKALWIRPQGLVSLDGAVWRQGLHQDGLVEAWRRRLLVRGAVRAAVHAAAAVLVDEQRVVQRDAFHEAHDVVDEHLLGKCQLHDFHQGA